MNLPAHKIEGVNRTKTMRFCPFVFTGKERDEETGYGYFGARYMDHELMTMWLSVDPMADKYPSLSPYNYCAWNPIRLVDPDGRDIDPSCIDEWDQRKQEIENKRNELLVYSLAYKNTGEKIFSRQAADYDELDKVITVMGEMEVSDQMYKLVPIDSKNNSGDTYLQGNTINVEYSSTAILAHELVHCGQFERREIGFSTNRRGGFTDYWDELSAYQAQAAYDANSLPRNQHPVLTIAWLTSIQKPDGSFPYANIGKVRYDGDSDCTRIKQAYPNFTDTWSGPFSSLKGTYFKPKKNTP